MWGKIAKWLGLAGDGFTVTSYGAWLEAQGGAVRI